MTSRTIEVTKPPDTTVPSVVGQTQNAATTALTNANLRTAVAHVASNSVAAGLVISQNPGGGKVVAPQTTVNLQVSSGRPAVIDLLARASSAQWTSGAGTLPFNGSDIDERGFVKPRSGFPLEDGSKPAFLETHPQWVNNGFIQGNFTLPRPIIAGDRFKATVGFMAVESPPSAGGGTFIVSVIKGGTATTIATVNDSASDGVMRPINVDLTPARGCHRDQVPLQRRPQLGSGLGVLGRTTNRRMISHGHRDESDRQSGADLARAGRDRRRGADCPEREPGRRALRRARGRSAEQRPVPV
ncbi:PASTA domain-containing protein [Kibdelosporangium aridum]|uniref:PASTA domain-containing protein n=1 Tax=Kibdelosporangium aridum TaxID=2030 RepID=UPI0035ED3F1F